jgi:hypothetical protein
MRQRIAIIATVAVVLGLLILLNALSYVQTTEQSDSEALPNRSTYHSGPTGTRAFYDLLNESGIKVTRWRESSDILLSQARANVSTFVVIGRTLLPFEEEEARNLLLWVEKGGCLVLIDRRPDTKLLPRSGNWNIAVALGDYPSGTIDPAKPEEMTAQVTSVHPVQPTLLTQSVESVKPSRFAAVIRFAYAKPTAKANSIEHGEAPASPTPFDPEEDPLLEKAEAEKDEAPVAGTPAPVTHLGDRRGALLADYPHGAGRIVVLSDPYIVANGGIQLEDNLQLAFNTVAARGGLIAFDEYHQGRAATQNAFAGYFAGTPILAMTGQVLLVVLVVLFTRARRFGRPLPLPQVDRRSSLEFVASMAELQQRARALDLAIENIYLRTRRVLARYAGVDYHSSRSEIAERVAARSSLNREQLEAVMRDCEEAINGGAVSERQSIALVRQLREIEGALGLRMRSRELKQAAEKI